MGGDEDKQMMDETGNDLDGFAPERYSNESVTVSGQPEPGNVVELEYSSSAGGAYASSEPRTIRGELMYVIPGHGDTLTFVMNDPADSRAVSFRLDADSVSSKNVRTLNAGKTKRGRRMGKVISVTFTEESEDTVAPVVNTIRSVIPGDTVRVGLTEYGVVSTSEGGPSQRPRNFSAILTTADGDEFVLETKPYRDGPRFRERFDRDEELDLDPASVQPGRFRERWNDHLHDREDQREDTTDAFPAPHGVSEGERVAFTLKPEDGEDERVSGTVTDVRHYENGERPDRQARDPFTKVELDDGREVKLRNTSKANTSVTRARWEKMDPEYRRIKAFVVTRTEGNGPNDYDHVEARDVEPEDTEGGDDEDGDDGGEGGEWDPEPAELRDGETEDLSAHARRNLEAKRQARQELGLDGEDSDRDGEDEQDAALITDGGEDLETLARQVSEALQESPAIHISRVHVSISPEDGGDVSVSGNGAMSRDDWTELADVITDVLDANGFQYEYRDSWAFVEVTGREVRSDGGAAADSGGGRITSLYDAVEDALDGRDVEITARRSGVRVRYEGPREPVTYALDDAGLSYGGGCDTIHGASAPDREGYLIVTGFQDGGDDGE